MGKVPGVASGYATAPTAVVNGRPVTLDISGLNPGRSGAEGSTSIDADTPPNATVASVVVENRANVIATVQVFNGDLKAGERKLNLVINDMPQQQVPVPSTSSRPSAAVGRISAWRASSVAGNSTS